MTEVIELVHGSDNPYADRGDPDAAAKMLKVSVMVEIIRLLDQHDLTAVQAAEMTGIGRSQISRIRNARISGMSIEVLIRTLEALTRVVTAERRVTFHIGYETRDVNTPTPPP